MRGLGLNEKLLQGLDRPGQSLHAFRAPCLANAIFPRISPFFGGSFVEDLVPRFDRPPSRPGCVTMAGRCVQGRSEERLRRAVHAGRDQSEHLRSRGARRGRRPANRDDVRRGQALTSSMTHELEGDFNVDFFVGALPR